jgi:GNAT superfamily N-acetyltransferase
MFIYRIATPQDLEQIWDYNIKANADDERWVRWWGEFRHYNESGKCITFVVLKDNEPVGEITLITSTECRAVKGKPLLCNGKDIASMNAFRIRKEYEGQGHISKLLKVAEEHARSIGMKALTIGCEARETRNLAIYLHWGYNEFVMHEIADDVLVLYYRKRL